MHYITNLVVSMFQHDHFMPCFTIIIVWLNLTELSIILQLFNVIRLQKQQLLTAEYYNKPSTTSVWKFTWSICKQKLQQQYNFFHHKNIITFYKFISYYYLVKYVFPLFLIKHVIMVSYLIAMQSGFDIHGLFQCIISMRFVLPQSLRVCLATSVLY